jgi:hypothetical protein
MKSNIITIRLKKRHILGKFALFVILCTTLLVSGCRTNRPPTFHISPDTDFSFIQRIAVVPFDNLTAVRAADEIVRQVVISEFLASGLVDVVVPGEVTSVLNSLGVKSTSSLNADHIRTIGKALKVEAVVMGSVEQYGFQKMGTVSAPELTVTLMMADTSTGSIIWSVTKTGGGASFMARHFGAKSKTMSETVLSVVREAIETFTEY